MRVKLLEIGLGFWRSPLMDIFCSFLELLFMEVGGGKILGMGVAKEVSFKMPFNFCKFAGLPLSLSRRKYPFGHRSI